MEPFTLHQITPNIYWSSPDGTTDRPILGAVTGQYGTLLVDAGNSPAHARLFLKSLAQFKIAPPTFLALTHWHWDHVFGASALDIPAFASQETKRVIEEMSQLDWSDEALDRRVEEGSEITFCRDMIKAELPDRADLKIKPPNIAFTDQIEVDLGGVTCLIAHVGGDHASDSSVIYVPQDKVIFLGDCLYQNLYSPLPTYTTLKLFPLIDRLHNFEADFYILAHHDEPMPRSEFVEFTDLLRRVGQTVERLGHHREDILREVGQPVNEDIIEIVDFFLAGLANHPAAPNPQTSLGVGQA